MRARPREHEKRRDTSGEASRRKGETMDRTRWPGPEEARLRAREMDNGPRPDVLRPENLAKDPELAAVCLNEALENGSPEEIDDVLRQVCRARDVEDVLKLSGLDGARVHRLLSPKGCLDIRAFRTLLGAMGLKLVVVPERN